MKTKSTKLNWLLFIFSVLFILIVCMIVPSFANGQSEESVLETNDSSMNASLSDDSSNIVGMYRLYNPYSGEHFYTTSLDEKDNLAMKGWKYEDYGWKAPKESTVPVYRLYNPYVGDHHYTTRKNEYIELADYGWRQEGIAWYSLNQTDNGAVPIYRQYNPYATTGTHNFTLSDNEKKTLVSLGWRDEDTAFWAYSLTENGSSAKTQFDFSKVSVDTSNKTYCGKQIAPAVTIDGLTEGTDYIVAYGENKNVGDGSITITGVGKYSGEKEFHFTIDRATVIFSGLVAKSRQYNGGTTAEFDYDYMVLTGKVKSDDLSIKATGAFTSKNVGSQITVDITYAELTGKDKGNYVLSLEKSQKKSYANITALKLSAMGTIGIEDKPYDGDTKATINKNEISLEGVIGGEEVTLTGDAYFNDKNAGTNKTVTIKNMKLQGSDAGNYTLDDGVTTIQTQGNITPAYIKSVTGLSAGEKTYDGEKSIKLITSEAIILGVITGDDVGVSGSGILKSPDAGNNKIVDIDSLSLTGDDAGNYSLEEAEIQKSTTCKVFAKVLELKWRGRSGVKEGDEKEFKYTYNRKSHLPTCSATNLIGSDTVNINVSLVGGNSAVNAGGYTAVAVLSSDVKNYKMPLNGTQKDFDIDKASPDLTDYKYSVQQVKVGTFLRDVEIEQPLTGEFEWVNPSLSVGNETGYFIFNAKFTPKDTVNYETIDEYAFMLQIVE